MPTKPKDWGEETVEVLETMPEPGAGDPEAGPMSAAPKGGGRPSVRLVKQPHGGALKIGNPGNKGKARSQVAREIVEAKTPQMARLLVKMALSGKNKFNKPMSVPDHVRCLCAALDRGKVPPAKILEGADGAAPTITVTTAAPKAVRGAGKGKEKAG